MLSENQIIRLILAFKIRSLRLKHEMSYQSLSDATGLSTSYLSDIEKGKRYPKPDKINLLAQALEVDYDYLISTKTDKKFRPVIDLISSKFTKLFPLDEFGISMDKVVDLFSQTPDKVNAFISTFFKIARNYQIDDQEFYLEALRSYQDLHNNHFPDLELAAVNFTEEYSISSQMVSSPTYLEDQLLELYDIHIDRQRLDNQKLLKSVRSYYSAKSKTLYLKSNLTSSQECFLICRELGFQYLKLVERPYETTIINIDSFEILWNNYKASHFAAALMMNAESIKQSLIESFRSPTWHENILMDLLDQYKVSPEMLMQRLTNILPHHFGLEDLFFIKLEDKVEDNGLRMSKDLHLSQLHNPYNNHLDEHYCRRWVAYRSLQEVSSKPKDTITAHVQISKFYNTDNFYLCFSLAEKSNRAKSVTLGLLINDKLRSIMYFLNDPNIPTKTVNTTCERCGIPDCDERVSPPKYIEQEQRQNDIIEALNLIDQ